MNSMKWYVLQVNSGDEFRVQKSLQRQNIESIIPVENRMIRKGGKWIQQEYILLSSYVFIHIGLDAAAYYMLRGISGVKKLLCTGDAPSPLLPEEVDWLLCFGSALLQPSTIEFLGGGVYRIVDGVLKDMVNQIEHIDRHKRRATVRVQMLGKPHTLKLSYRVYQGSK